MATKEKRLDVEDEAVIRRLTVCYALGTDAIGHGELKEGLALYHDCFTDDFVFSLFLPGNEDPVDVVTGTSAWADYVDNAFRTQPSPTGGAPGYSATQHLLGSIDVQSHGERGTMSTYLQATHFFIDPPGAVNIVFGTYRDVVRRINGRWLITERGLEILGNVLEGLPTGSS